MVRSAGILLFFLWACAAVWAQSPGAALVGVVHDATGHPVNQVLVTAHSLQSVLQRSGRSNAQGEYRLDGLPPGAYRITAELQDWRTLTVPDFRIWVGSTNNLSLTLHPHGLTQTVDVHASSPWTVDTTSSVEQGVVSQHEIESFPLAHRSFANIAFLTPMTAPVEPSDPTKARITAVSFGGSSGLNIDLSVDGGDNNDDFIGGFLQNYSPESMQEFVVRTAQFDADTSRTNGGSIIIATKRGTDQWHGDGALFARGQSMMARNTLDNPQPNPKQPFSFLDGSFDLGGPLRKRKLWFFTSADGVRENASVAYNNTNLGQFRALAQLASQGQIPGVPSITVPTSVVSPYRDFLMDTRLDWSPSASTEWFLRVSFDRNRTANSLLQQGALPSTGVLNHNHYSTVLAHEEQSFGPEWLGSLTMEASDFYLDQLPNSQLGLALAFPFSANYLATSGFETFGQNQFISPAAAFPTGRKQQKYQFRYDLARADADHSLKVGVNFIHEPVLSGTLANAPTQLVTFDHNPGYYLQNGISLLPLIQATPVTGGGNGSWSQNVQRLGLYAQDSWRLLPQLTINYGLRYDTTFGLFQASGRSQAQNPGVAAIQQLNLPLPKGVPHDYRGALAPRLGIAWSPGSSERTVLRAGIGMYYNDLTQNGWVEAFQAVNSPLQAPLGAGDQGSVIDPSYHTPYDIQVSGGVEHVFGNGWRANVFYEHHQGVHQYRRYEYVAGYTLPASAPSLSVFRTDNRSRYDGASFELQRHFHNGLDLTAHYTLAKAGTWGATVGELFDYVNGVSNVNNAFGPGDWGPSGEDIRHRFVFAADWRLPWGMEVSSLGQFESARPFTITTPVDVNNDGTNTNDRAVVNGVQTTLDQFRGSPFQQVDLRVSRRFHLGERTSLRVFGEFFNLFNRMNAGNNYVTDISALPTPVNNLANATAFCLNASCTQTKPITSLSQLLVPAGAIGDLFGPGTTVGMPFSAQLGFRLSF